MMEYKGYIAETEFDDSVGVLHGRVANMRDVISFEAESVEQLRCEMRMAIDDYLTWCAERGEAPEKPYSGNFLVRGTPALHRDVAGAAARQGKSMNAWVTETLERAVRE